MNAINPIDLFKGNDNQLFTALFNASFVISYGFITEVLDTNEVIVQIAYKLGTCDRLVQCTYVVPSNSNLEVDSDPTEGDNVLILALQHLDSKTMEATESNQVKSMTGYGFFSAIAIPIGTRKGKAKCSVKVTDSTLEVTAPDIDAEISLNTLKLMGTGSHFTKWEELNTTLQNILTILKGHVHPDPVTGMTGPSAEVQAITLDLSRAKTPHIETGDA